METDFKYSTIKIIYILNKLINVNVKTSPPQPEKHKHQISEISKTGRLYFPTDDKSDKY